MWIYGIIAFAVLRLAYLGVRGFFTGSFQAFQGAAIWFACFLAISSRNIKRCAHAPMLARNLLENQREGT